MGSGGVSQQQQQQQQHSSLHNPKKRRLAVHCRLSRATYLAGETVHGLVVVTSYADQPAERVSIRVHGHARIDHRWLPDVSLARPPPLPPSLSPSHPPPPSSSVPPVPGHEEGGEGERGGGGIASSLYRFSVSLLGMGGGGGGGEGGGENEEGREERGKQHSSPPLNKRVTDPLLLPASNPYFGSTESLLPSYPDLRKQAGLACVYTTPPLVLTRARTPFAPCQQLTYRFRLALPAHLLPSYNRGTGARFFYMCTVAVGGQGQERPMRYIHIPFTVLSSGFMDLPMPPSNYVAVGFLEGEEVHSRLIGEEERREIYGEGGNDQDEGERGFCWRRFSAKYLRNANEEVIPHNYHDDSDNEEEEEWKDDRNDVYMAGLTFRPSSLPPSSSLPSSPARRGGPACTIYAIRNGTANLGKFVTYSQAYRPGAPFDGVFDFSDGILRCYQISACMVREEWTYHAQPAQRKLLARTVEDTFHELTASCLSCAVFLKVPIDASPTFSTPFTCLEWKVCFEFVTSKEEDALREAALIEEEKQARIEELRDLLLSSTSDNETETEDDTLILEETEVVDEDEGGEGQPRKSGCPETVTALHTSKLRWTFPIRVIPPNDTDPTDLFLDYHVARCSMEMHI
ncbi:hypothetical protein VYU27_008556 [Nannochloropsis oceanica]